jgi:1-acyl-sn-glycerol-3-phosphate acyltransferase
LTRTIFNTPIISNLGHHFGKTYLRLAGWKVKGVKPEFAKYVMVAGPHTSNWDFWYLLLSIFQLRMEMQWMGKHTLFPRGLGWFTRWLGGVPVVRSKSNNLTAQMITALQQADRMILTITPEGTRGSVTKWKTGFYHIALGAEVPIVMVYCDYAKKETGFGPTIYPTGEIESQLPEMQAFYQNVSGKFAQGTIVHS